MYMKNNFIKKILNSVISTSLEECNFDMQLRFSLMDTDRSHRSNADINPSPVKEYTIFVYTSLLSESEQIDGLFKQSF